MIPWLLVLQVMMRARQVASALVAERMRRFPASGEINRKLPGDAKRCCRGRSSSTRRRRWTVDYTDGLSVEFADWRFNLRGSNTEPLVRLNVESRGNESADAGQDRRAAAVSI